MVSIEGEEGAPLERKKELRSALELVPFLPWCEDVSDRMAWSWGLSREMARDPASRGHRRSRCVLAIPFGPRECILESGVWGREGVMKRK